MVKNLINEIEQAMLGSLNNEQLAQLRKVLDYTFRNIVVTEKDAVNTESNNQILVENFISAKMFEIQNTAYGEETHDFAVSC